jgi:hypothetical protein
VTKTPRATVTSGVNTTVTATATVKKKIVRTVTATVTKRPSGSGGSGAATDPRFSYCYEANDAGYGPYVSGVDPEYDWYRDADNDGVVCET